MVKIRLMRIGSKGRPFYRVVAVDQRNRRSGAYIELLGTYNPISEPHEIILKQDRIDDWIKKGAQMSDGFLRIIGKAPQKPPRKAKKEKKTEAVSPKPVDKTEETGESAPTETATNEEPVAETAAPAVETPDEADAAVEETTDEAATEENAEVAETESKKDEQITAEHEATQSDAGEVKEDAAKSES